MAENEKQYATDYEPSLSEEKLLEVLLNPQYRMKSITDICGIAGIDRSTYYRAFAKPGFNELYKQKSIELVNQQVAPVINAFVAEAKRGSFQHGKVLLEMGGVYTEKQQIEATNTNLNTELTDLPPEERAKRIAELTEKLNNEK